MKQYKRFKVIGFLILFFIIYRLIQHYLIPDIDASQMKLPKQATYIKMNKDNPNGKVTLDSNVELIVSETSITIVDGTQEEVFALDRDKKLLTGRTTTYFYSVALDVVYMTEKDNNKNHTSWVKEGSESEQAIIDGRMTTSN